MKRLFFAVLRRFLWGVGYLLPIKKDRILISSYYGRGYGDNLKYIVEELIKRIPTAEIVWLVKDEKEAKSLPANIKASRYGSFRSIFYFVTAGIWIDNCRKSFFYKKKRQLYIQTWHGGGAQKKCELDAVDKLSPAYTKMALKDSKNIDIMISESRFLTEMYYRSFWYDGPVYECGYPRYDLLLNHDETLRDRVYAYFGIDKEKLLVLYAPTFRVDYSFKAYNVDFERLRKSLNKRFGNDYVVLVHLHPNVANIEGGMDYNGTTVINATFYPDTQELIAAASILVGDYSSINYDFSLKKMPVIRYVTDLEEYRNDRDLYFSFDEYPYPCAMDNDELEELVLNFDDEEYLERLDAFFAKIGAVFCRNSSEKIADLIVDYLHSKKKKDFFERNMHRLVAKNEIM